MNKYIYTVSDRGNMYSDLINSTNSLLRFVEPYRIIIVHTSPVNRKHFNELEHRGIINLETCNELHPFNINKYNKENRIGYYGEKIAKLNNFALDDNDNVAFFDCDTIIKGNVDSLFNKDFDVAIRLDKGFTSFNINNWVKQLNEMELYCIPMVNTGVMLFKNGYHNLISKYAKYYYDNVDWLDFHPISQFIDQYSVTCAISKCMKEIKDFKVWWLDASIHGMRWENEITEPIIKHGSRKRLFRKVIRKVREYVYYVS